MFIKNNGVTLRIIEDDVEDPSNPIAGLLSAMDPLGQLQSVLQDTRQALEAPSEVYVDHPSHYRQDSGLEAIDAIEAWDLNFNLGNVIKYVCRAGLKTRQDGSIDLKKALWYLKREISSRTKEA
tara:strand:- start:126 stop:497 length:372 start_codon:yes stop_codon:yes gene_type:complete